MNVYLRAADEIEFLGCATPPAGPGDEYVVDIAIGGVGEALRLVYEMRTVASLTEEGLVGRERVVLLAPGQTPDFLPGWEPAGPDTGH